MAVWSRVWGPSGTGGCSSSCSSSCYNPLTGSGSAQYGNILDGFPLSIETCGQAMSVFAQQLQARLSAQSVIVRAATTTGSVFDLDVRLGPKATEFASVKVTFTNVKCDFPVTSTYTLGAKTGSAKFVELGQLLDWLAINLR